MRYFTSVQYDNSKLMLIETVVEYSQKQKTDNELVGCIRPYTNCVKNFGNGVGRKDLLFERSEFRYFPTKWTKFSKFVYSLDFFGSFFHQGKNELPNSLTTSNS